MTRSRSRPALGTAALFLGAFFAGSYFTFAAVQGDYGMFRRIQVEAETAALRTERDRLAGELAVIENLNRRLSDDWLDLDLLDERARDVLGHLHRDDVVIP
jgi:cell division protein FtsB